VKIPRANPLPPGYVNAWHAEAAKIGMEYGILVKVVYHSNFYGNYNGRIYFKLGEHEFETLPELRKAIQLISFI